MAAGGVVVSCGVGVAGGASIFGIRFLLRKTEGGGFVAGGRRISCADRDFRPYIPPPPFLRLGNSRGNRLFHVIEEHKRLGPTGMWNQACSAQPYSITVGGRKQRHTVTDPGHELVDERRVFDLAMNLARSPSLSLRI